VLDLTGLKSGTIDILPLATSLMKNKSLAQLKIGNNTIVGHGLDSLARALETNDSLKKLHMEGVHYNEGFQALFSKVSTFKGLEYLDVSENVMPSDSLEILANELRSNTTPQHVKAKDVQSSDDDIQTLLQRLKDHPTLKSLDVSKLDDKYLDRIMYLVPSDKTEVQLKYGEERHLGDFACMVTLLKDYCGETITINFKRDDDNSDKPSATLNGYTIIAYTGRIQDIVDVITSIGVEKYESKTSQVPCFLMLAANY
jgi:hypothetical protein